MVRCPNAFELLPRLAQVWKALRRGQRTRDLSRPLCVPLFEHPMRILDCLPPSFLPSLHPPPPPAPWTSGCSTSSLQPRPPPPRSSPQLQGRSPPLCLHVRPVRLLLRVFVALLEPSVPPTRLPLLLRPQPVRFRPRGLLRLRQVRPRQPVLVPLVPSVPSACLAPPLRLRPVRLLQRAPRVALRVVPRVRSSRMFILCVFGLFVFFYGPQALRDGSPRGCVVRTSFN